jgi:hypothetical protein
VADLLLGSKRPSRARKIARMTVAGTILVIGALLASWFAFRRATTYAVPRGQVPTDPLTSDGGRLVLGDSSLERQGGLYVLRLSGDPWTLGAARARLLGALVGEDAALDAAVAGEHAPSGWFAGRRREARLGWRWRLLVDSIPADRRRELGGMAATLRSMDVANAPTYQRLVWRQAALDAGAPPGATLPFGGVARGLALAVGGDKLVVGRSLWLPGASPDPPRDVVVSFVKEDGAIPFAQIGWPGEVGVLTGVNAEGIALIVNPAVAEGVSATRGAEPCALIARDVLAHSRTLDEAIAAIGDAKALGAASFLVADGKTRVWAIVDRSPAKTAVVKPKPTEMTGMIDDLLGAPDFDKDAENDRARRGMLGARSARLAALLAKGVPPEPSAVVTILRDRAGEGGAQLPLGSGNAIDDLAQQHVAVVDVSAMLLWVADGNGAAMGAAGRMRAFDLRAELRGEPARLVDSLVMQPDGSVDPADAARLSEARAAYREGARLARDHHRRQAEDAATRALALDANLAEAWLLSAQLAHADHDDDRAATAYRHYLDLSPSDRNGIAEAKAALGQ